MKKLQQPARGPASPSSSPRILGSGFGEMIQGGYNDAPPKERYSMNQGPQNMQKPPPPPPPPPKK